MKGKVSLLIVTSSLGVQRIRLDSMTQHLIGVRSIAIELNSEIHSHKEGIEKSAEEVFQKFFSKKYLVEDICELRVFVMSFTTILRSGPECSVHEDPFAKKVEDVLLKKITVFKESFK